MKLIGASVHFHFNLIRSLTNNQPKEKYIIYSVTCFEKTLRTRPLLGHRIGSSRNALGLCSNLRTEEGPPPLQCIVLPGLIGVYPCPGPIFPNYITRN
jgi:hypothetical protein